MATKTFKIGLSTSDKSAMAQDVYERLIAMCFDEYDSTKVYNAGDFVVYENPADTFKLYKCKEDNVTGTWNSAKWELATFQDLVDDVEDAVASVDGKANVDGNYPTMTVGLADNLTPYDEESGDDQDEPFSFQATGTANGTQSDFATGSGALLREKQGHTLVVNSWLYPISDSRNGLTSTYDATNKKWHVTGTTDGYAGIHLAEKNNPDRVCKLINGHKYLVLLKMTFANETDEGSGFYVIGNSTIVGQKKNSFVFTSTETYSPADLQVIWGTASLVVDCYVEISAFTDLTQMFNGDIPQDLLDNPSNFFRYYQGSLAYNTGTLVNANSQYIKCIGRQQWDEVAEAGAIDFSTGADSADNTRIRSKNYIRVVPNTTYYIYQANTSSAGRIAFYDKDKNHISSTSVVNTTFTTPANACYMRFCTYAGYGNTYNHDITISIYYSGESGYDQYYPYEVLTNTDTGTETLRQAGSVKDYKTPDGVVHRLVGTVDLSTISWQYSEQGYWYAYQVIPAKTPSSTSVKANLSSTNYVVDTFAHVYDNNSLNIIGLHNNGLLGIYNGSSTTEPTGTLYYELATPTEEQGTTFSPNLVIDDFGSMEFSGTSGVPQGNLIFYPVDYKAFVDTLYDYTEGTPSNLVLQSERTSDKSAQATVDTQLQNAIGGTLRQCLCVKESLDFDGTNVIDLGTLNWMYRSADGVFTLNNDFLTDAPNTTFKILCTKYQTNNVSAGNMSDKQISARPNYNNKDITIKDSSYTDATTFKAAMKGVLLAYEKGE